MCESGVHIGQLKLALAQIDESMALSQKWLEQIHHVADHGGLTASSTSVAQATVLVGEARAKLERALIDLDSGDEDVTVKRV